MDLKSGDILSIVRDIPSLSRHKGEVLTVISLEPWWGELYILEFTMLSDNKKYTEHFTLKELEEIFILVDTYIIGSTLIFKSEQGKPSRYQGLVTSIDKDGYSIIRVGEL